MSEAQLAQALTCGVPRGEIAAESNATEGLPSCLAYAIPSTLALQRSELQ
jgi:hypothetical protein